ncbi:ubiquitin-specific protease UBP1 [Aspergillus undulatus]|uniref:ubiquitin-specific protease UBP1 n=1 Tax=Aspergillus undulatus TaxID=1810928 RepID=UPI003CCCECAD
MNARREGIDFLAQSRYTTQPNHYDTFWGHLQDNANLTYILATAVSVLFLLNYFRSVPASFIGAVWGIVVHLTPTRIIVALDSKATTASNEPSDSMTLQAKSEAMQRILGLDGATFPSFFPRSTPFSGLGTAILGNKDTVPPGLGNWDNSCYQNSIIQGLASLPSFADFLGRNIDQLSGKVSFSTHEALRGIIERLNDAENHGQRLWTPPDLKSMSSWQQQDAQEYFSKVVDQIDHEVQQATRRRTSNLGLKMAGPQEHVIGTISAQVDGAAQMGPERVSLRNPLEGLLAQRVGCMQCGWTEGLSLIPFNCLTVPLGPGYEYDVRDCLDEYMNLEPIEGVECAKCTLLRTRDQLRNLLQQIEEDEKILQSNGSTKVSDALKTSAEQRLQAVDEAIEETDFTEKTLSKKCHIPSKNRVSTTKSRQAVIARPPSCLTIHVNRSVFDEHTGLLRKNYAAVKFPRVLELNEWCLGGGSREAVEHIENWGTDPRVSMLPPPGAVGDTSGRRYELRAVVTHYGRHENGHYICYRKHPVNLFPVHVPEAVLEADGDKEKSERWYRLSDEDVQMVSEENVMTQGGAFMLFYEAVGASTPRVGSNSNEIGNRESSFSSPAPEDMSSITSTVTDRSSTASDTSRATSVSADGESSDKSQPGLGVD